ncbi:glycosyl transferase family 1 [Mycobacterium vulneris]|nr:glycosyl transferase family 1 [Mycolicibacterium vulneris]
MSDARIALVHERFTEIAGSENVVEQFALQWPDAEVFAAITKSGCIPDGITSPVHATWLNHGYRLVGQRSYAPLAPLIPAAFRHMDLKGFDAVLVSHHAFATQAVFATDAPVIAYVHSPARWAWEPAMRAQEAGGPAGAAALAALGRIAKRGESAAAPRLRRVVANSTAVAERITNWWHRDSTVVHPPVDTDGFTPDPAIEREDFFLLAGRLVPYKRPDLAIAAATKAGVRLIVAGDGRSMKQCQELAGPNVSFLGRVPHDQLLDLHRRTRALLMPGVEDFGIVPVESMATGTPVIALGAGGALDTVIPESTGALVSPGSDEEIIDGFVSAITAFDPSRYDATNIRNWAEGFSEANFRAKMQQVMDEVLS